MNTSIYTIPIAEVFEPKCGCPICRMRDMLEQRCIEYIMGAAMMEPDVRVETNKQGFCATHFEMMLHQKNRLSLSLMLESHLDELIKKHINGKPNPKAKEKTPAHECFVCSQIGDALEKLISNMLKTYETDGEFRELFSKQEFFCYLHYDMLAALSPQLMSRKMLTPFLDELYRLTKAYAELLYKNVHDFSSMFDYRNTSKEKSEDTINSIEKAIAFLTARE